MGKTFKAAVWSSALVLLLCGSALAQTGVIVSQDSYWQITNRQVLIHAAAIQNTAAEDTGPLFISIYARSGVVYDGNNSLGTLLARAPLDSIPAGQTVNDVLVTARLRPVRPGLKFTTLVVERQNRRRYETVYWNVYTSRYAFPHQNGGVGSDDSAIGRGDIEATAPALSGRGRRAVFDVERIQSQREVEVTGSIRLAVYASKTPTEGGPGKLIGTRTLGHLAPGDYFHHLQGTITLRSPGRPGLYYVTLQIEELTDLGAMAIQSVTEAAPRRF